MSTPRTQHLICTYRRKQMLRGQGFGALFVASTLHSAASAWHAPPHATSTILANPPAPLLTSPYVTLKRGHVDRSAVTATSSCKKGAMRNGPFIFIRNQPIGMQKGPSRLFYPMRRTLYNYVLFKSKKDERCRVKYLGVLFDNEIVDIYQAEEGGPLEKPRKTHIQALLRTPKSRFPRFILVVDHFYFAFHFSQRNGSLNDYIPL